MALPFSGTAIPLRPTDISDAAQELGCEPAVVRAVVTVEAGGGSGFLSDGSGRPKILCEAKVFGEETGHRFGEAHPDISRRIWVPSLYLGGAAEYGRLAKMVRLDRRAGLLATSQGAFQVLGRNHKMVGFPDVEDFVAAMAESEDRQLEAFIAYCRAAKLIEALRTRDWARFARGYNGPGYATNHYDTKLEAAYRDAVDGPPALPVLRLGAFGAAVRRLQVALNRVTNAVAIKADGDFGRATELAVIRFQLRQRLKADGVAGRLTLSALGLLDAEG